MKIYAIQRQDGSIAVMTLIDGIDIEGEINKWPQLEQDKVLGWKEVSIDVLPSDRSFRDAWRMDIDKVIINLDAAKTIKMQQLRALRDEKLKFLDIVYMRADEQGDEASKITISEQKQALRDLPQTEKFANIVTVEQLKIYTPSILL